MVGGATFAPKIGPKTKFFEIESMIIVCFFHEILDGLVVFDLWYELNRG